MEYITSLVTYVLSSKMVVVPQRISLLEVILCHIQVYVFVPLKKELNYPPPPHTHTHTHTHAHGFRHFVEIKSSDIVLAYVLPIKT